MSLSVIYLRLFNMLAIKNLEKAAERILKAIKQKENIILYGDADLDGTTSVIILKETVQNLNGKIIAVYFPDREIEGYGISEIGLNFLKNHSPALLIALDCGIGNFREIKEAKKLGFEVIIIDHHEILDKLPQAKIIVDPKQKGDKYPFKGLATAGIAFELSELLLRDKMTPALRKNFLELTALATLADMMPQESENKIFIEEGLQSLENSWRPGIKAFFETEFFGSLTGMRQKVGKMISILNVRDVKNQLPASFRLLNTPSLEEAKIFIEEFLVKNKIRRAAIEKIIEEIEKRIVGKNEPIIFEGDVFFEMELMGAAASVTCQQYQKPTFLYKKMKTESQGTVRIPDDINSVTLMKKCSKYLLTYGGHPRASGFRIKNENLEKFKNCLIKEIKSLFHPSL